MNKIPMINLISHEAGKEILKALNDDEIIEIMVNPNGSLWTEDYKGKMHEVGKIPADNIDGFIRVLAGSKNKIANERHSILELELPEEFGFARFEGVLPPTTTDGPGFAIRKRAKRIYTFDDYIENGILTEKQAEIIKQAILDRKNILICGGPGTGKTTFANACIDQLVKHGDPNQRIITMEDVKELQCSADNTFGMLTSKGVELSDLLAATLRLRPDRILVGEVRNKAMLDLLKAWNTGCPGGLATIHANGAEAAIQRCSDLAQEANVPAPISLICETVNLIVAIQRVPGGRIIKEVTALSGHDGSRFLFEKLA